MSELCFAPAVELAAALRRRDISSRELLAIYVERLAQHGSAVNAVVALDLERASERAAAADEATSRGESWGPLHGLPMTVKDAFETAGLVTTRGAAELREYIPRADANAVTRLRNAGAVIFGSSAGRSLRTRRGEHRNRSQR